MVVGTPSFHSGVSSGLNIHQNYNIQKNVVNFTTTSNTFQEAHKFIFNIPESGLYRISWSCMWESKRGKENNIEIEVLLDGIQGLLCEKMSKFANGADTINFNQGNHNLSFNVRSAVCGEESKVLYTRFEYFRIYN